jgi:hypothetical protein
MHDVALHVAVLGDADLHHLLHDAVLFCSRCQLFALIHAIVENLLLAAKQERS